jgi:CheY-like chemotaxis protein
MSEHNVHFLIVEGNDDHAELLGMELDGDDERITVDRVADGEAALAYLRQQEPYTDRPRPTVVLLDLNLPKISGLEVLATLKRDEGLRAIPVVILSTSAAARDKIRAYESFANSYLVKPVDFDRFQQMIHTLKAYWSMCNEAA